MPADGRPVGGKPLCEELPVKEAIGGFEGLDELNGTLSGMTIPSRSKDAGAGCLFREPVKATCYVFLIYKFEPNVADGGLPYLMAYFGPFALPGLGILL